MNDKNVKQVQDQHKIHIFCHLVLKLIIVSFLHFIMPIVEQFCVCFFVLKKKQYTCFVIFLYAVAYWYCHAFAVCVESCLRFGWICCLLWSWMIIVERFSTWSSYHKWDFRSKYLMLETQHLWSSKCSTFNACDSRQANVESINEQNSNDIYHFILVINTYITDKSL